MFKSGLMIAAMVAGLSSTAMAEGPDKGIERVTSPLGVEEVDQRLRGALEERGLTLVAVVDHTANARSVDLELPATRTFIFGNPKVGTPFMQCQGSVALDLPQKMVLREADGAIYLEWNSPRYLAERHGLEACGLPLEKVAAVLNELAREAAGEGNQ
ncbi:hypothetical protein L861_11245 [Litchfieldella anticariensis FP35 = DSM 16096]|uniref:DUF302 domain-containing protein n=1 Tax=Litchfieldella anticariensis (strain DSM 16096 / CECT 5854 / CIP 108499 / LMG 22089 / FP35) TaxID=1121939 RepID=S2KG81_LITA3|nr:DUF302 domain-containing protein [Halomonas anticariensis]EPC01142.1 hypothetical protein L861_11245 [Halomonas anticariensis FP35 = DSM 16096]